LFTAILAKQFSNLENGDQFFYRNELFTPQDLAIINQGSTLAQIITTNTGVTNLQANVFYYQPQSVVNNTLIVVGGSGTNDSVQINPIGTSNTGSTGVQVVVTLRGVNTTTTYSQDFTSIVFFGGGGNDTVLVAPSVTIPVSVIAGNGNDVVLLGSGNNIVTLGNGTDLVVAGTAVSTGNNNIQLGNGNNDIVALLGNGNDQVLLGNGANDLVTMLGNGNDSIQVGNGNSNLVVLVGNGNDDIQVGNGNDDTVILEGNGNDDIQTGSGSGVVIDFGTGTKTVHLGSSGWFAI
jgi:Ca2+-binding RTX toxin-like protein